MLEPGRNCWRIESADQLAVIVDADRYFAAARQALLDAKRRVMLVGWDFDARIDLCGSEGASEGPANVGQFLHWLVERTPGLELYLLRWDVGALKSVFRGSTAFTMMKLLKHPRIHMKLDGHHPIGSSHHQKIVSIDDCLAFCGGIDVTSERWDTRAHRDGDPGRRRPDGKPYKPWHDATTAFTGPAAAAIGELCRARWQIAAGETLEPITERSDCWPAGLTPTFGDVELAIARTQPNMADSPAITEVEALFLDQIASAKRHLYCESQYFASRRIAEAVAKRLGDPGGPEIVIVNPLSAQGWLEPLAMDTARARLMTALWQRDSYRKLRLYHPHTRAGAPIYVHAKITVVDDTQLRIGSANINNRSMRLDTECDVLIDTTRQSGQGVGQAITRVRDDLIAEHLDVPAERVTALIERTGSLIETIEQLRGPGRTLVPYEVPDLQTVEAWLADNEVLDPEGPGEMFEALSQRGLFRGLLKRHR